MKRAMHWIKSQIKKHRIKKQFLHLLIILLVIIGLLEIIGLFVFDNRYYWNSRYLNYSESALTNQTIEYQGKSVVFWKYRPNEEVRTSAVYADFLGAKIEYDCKFTTNRLGFIDAGNPDAPVDFLILGDSFTEGQGGCPWLTKKALESDKELKQFNLLNGGLQGTGIQAFEKVLAFHEQSVDLKNVIIIAISNDFKRGDAFAWPLENPCYRALDCDQDDYWYFTKKNISDTALKQQAINRRMDRKPSLKQEISRYSFTWFVYQKLAGILRSTQKPSLTAYEANFAALERIKAKYPNMALILVPQRDEVGLFGRENFDTQYVKQFLQKKGIAFSSCELEAGDYMPIDGHPNALGYEKLMGCVKAYLISLP